MAGLFKNLIRLGKSLSGRGISMAHFAEVINGVVERVVVVGNPDITDEHGIENPEWALNWLPPTDGKWVQTSYNHNFRGTYAGIGYAYDEQQDVFIAPPLPEILTSPPREE
jgi:hypothetical protein